MVTSRPEIVGTFGVVATTHWLATTTGMTILERGGNAFDAAVAAGFVLHIVEPDQNGPGGDLPIVLWSAARGQRRGGLRPGRRAGRRRRRRACSRYGLDLMPGTGHLPAVVPGSFGAWMLLLRDYGTMTPREVLEPAITIARDGFVLKPAVAELIGGLGAIFEPSTGRRPPRCTCRAAGRPPATRSTRCRPRATTYERIVREAEAAGIGPRGADRGGAPGLVRRLRGGGDRRASSAPR